MVSRRVVIGVGILIVMMLGLIFFSNVTGNAITGLMIKGEKIDDEYFKIDDSKNIEIPEDEFDNQVNENGGLNDTQNSSESG